MGSIYGISFHSFSMAFFFAAPKYFSLLTVLRIGVGLDIISAQ
jgi:hypothetical protein